MHEIIIAGFGGQGVLVMGQLLAYAGMMDNKQVSWYPSYGPEQRGGTCNCSVVISESEVGSPIVSQPSAAIIMNLPSLERFEPDIRPGGLLILNSSLISKTPKRKDIRVIAVPANKIAEQLGNARVSNMALLGAFVAATNVVTTVKVQESLKHVLPPRHHGLIDLNMQAFSEGRAYQ